jgi:hypothetical protein
MMKKLVWHDSIPVIPVHISLSYLKLMPRPMVGIFQERQRSKLDGYSMTTLNPMLLNLASGERLRR